MKDNVIFIKLAGKTFEAGFINSENSLLMLFSIDGQFYAWLFSFFILKMAQLVATHCEKSFQVSWADRWLHPLFLKAELHDLCLSTQFHLYQLRQTALCSCCPLFTRFSQGYFRLSKTDLSFDGCSLCTKASQMYFHHLCPSIDFYLSQYSSLWSSTSMSPL